MQKRMRVVPLIPKQSGGTNDFKQSNTLMYARYAPHIIMGTFQA